MISAEILLDRLSGQQVRSLWPLLARWESPAGTLAGEPELREIAAWLDRAARADRITEIAAQPRQTHRNASTTTRPSARSPA